MSRTQAVVRGLLAGLVLTVMSAVAGAVGLGEVTLRSALTEPLDAEIRITNPADLTQEELTVRLASNEDFRRAGVERPFFLSQLEFDVQPDGDEFVIVVTSADPVQEPFLDFLVELRWPSGRLIREYTLLLDPPVFADGDSVMEQTFPASDPFTDGVEPAPELPEIEAPAQPQPSQPERRVEELPDSQYRVANNDTLWEIALRARQDPGQTPQQVMLAIQDMNPDAFIGGNINRVKAGSLLDLPSAEQVAVRSAAEANQEVSRQNAALTGTPPDTDTQITATDDTATGLADGDPARDPDGFLEVVTEPDEPAETADVEGAEDTELARLQNELSIQQELNDELRRQYDEQQSRLADLEEQVQLLSRLMDLQSESAAQLQAAAEELERLEAEAEREEALSEDELPVAPTPTPEIPPTDMAEAPVDPETPAAPEAEPPSEPATPAESEAPAVEATVPDLDAPVAVSPWTIVDDLVAWISRPLNGVLVLSGLVLILGLVKLAQKKREEKDAEEALDVDEELMTGETDVAPELDDSADHSDELPPDDELAAAPVSGGAGGGAVAAEAIENAELYMAFQRYDEAEAALKGALEQVPGEPSLQQKLMELHAETGNRAAFEKVAGDFQGDAQVVDTLRSQIQGDGSDHFASDDLSEDFGDGEFDDLDLELDLDLDDSESAPSGPRQQAAPEPEDNFDVPELGDTLDTTEDDMSLDFAPDSLEESPEPRPSAGGDQTQDDELALDFDLSDTDLEGADTPEPTRAREEDSASLADDGGLDLSDDDLDLDFDFGDLDTEATPEDTTSWDAEETDSDVLGDIPELEDPFPESEETAEDWSDFEVAEEPISEPATAERLPEAEPEPAAAEPEPAVAESDLSGVSEEVATETIDEGDWDEDFDFLAGTDEVATKLDLARAYIDMEDGEGAKDILNEVLEEGTDEQKSDARKLLETI